MKERLNIKGTFHLELFDEFGNLKDQRTCPNVMCNIGMGELANFLVSNLFVGANSAALNFVSAPSVWLAIGDGAATPAATDTQLVSEVFRQALTTSNSPAPSSSQPPSFTWYTLIGQTVNPLTVTEAGVFLNATGTVNSGDLLDHSVISPSISKTPAELLNVQVTFALS